MEAPILQLAEAPTAVPMLALLADLASVVIAAAMLILVVFLSTGYFFVEVVALTVQKSQETKGLIGKASRHLSRISCLRRCLRRRAKRKKKKKVTPKLRRWDLKTAMRALDKKRRETHVKSIQESSRVHRERLLAKIRRAKMDRGARLQARLAARK